MPSHSSLRLYYLSFLPTQLLPSTQLDATCQLTYIWLAFKCLIPCRRICLSSSVNQSKKMLSRRPQTNALLAGQRSGFCWPASKSTFMLSCKRLSFRLGTAELRTACDGDSGVSGGRRTAMTKDLEETQEGQTGCKAWAWEQSSKEVQLEQERACRPLLILWEKQQPMCNE